MSAPRLRLHTLDVPLAAPFRIAYDVVTEVRNALAVAEADGLTGYGEAAPVKSITGEDRAAIHAAWQQWSRSFKAQTPRDARDPMALAVGCISLRAAMEGALLDLQARHAERPLCTYLSGRAPAQVPTSITLGLVDDAEVASWVAKRKAQGFRILKVKAGLGLARDLARIVTVRELAGPNVALRVDPNQAWSREEARTALRTLRDAGVTMLEQPLRKDDLVGHAALRNDMRSHGIALMLDESIFSAQDAIRALATGACDWVNIKLQKCGGIIPGLHIAAIAEAAGVPCMVGCMVETRVGILQAAHLVLSHPNIQAADLDGHTFLKSDPVSGGGVLRDGALRVGGEHGLGVSAVAHGEELASSASPM